MVWGLGLTAPSGNAYAQANNTLYSLVLRGVPVRAALDQLVAETRIDLFYEDHLVRDRRTTCVRDGASPEELLRCILSDTGLDFVRYSSGLYVIVSRVESVPLYGRLTGVVVDAATGQPLPAAHVVLADASTGTTANEAGRFAFARLRPGRYQVMATHVGYRNGATHVDVPPGGDALAELALEAAPLLVEPVVIDGLQWRLPSEGLGEAARNPLERLETPTFGADVLTGLGTMLGVRMSEATAAVHVQGGETGEHQLRLDGAPVFLPLSYASFIGPFSPFAVGRITVQKAGFGPAHGSQIAGVIDLEHHLDLSAPREVQVQVDPMSLNAQVGLRRGRAAHRQLTAVTAARVGLWDVYRPETVRALLESWDGADPFLSAAFDRTVDNARFLADTTRGNPGIGFLDLHGAMRLRFGLLRSLHASAYWGESRLGTDVEEARSDLSTSPDGGDAVLPFRDRYAWRTGVAQTRYEAVLSTRLLASVGVRGSYARLEHTYLLPENLRTPTSEAATADPAAASMSVEPPPDDGNRLFELGLDARFDYVYGQRHDLEGGLELVRTDSRFEVLGTNPYPIRHASRGWRLAAYGQDVVRVSGHTTLEFGGRLTYLPSVGRLFAEPRAAFRVDAPDTPLGAVALRLSAGRYRQFVNQFDVSTRSPSALLSSTRFWLPADSTVAPPDAVHLAGALLVRPTPAWTIRLETFLKDQRHILAIDYASRAGASSPDEQLAQRDFLRASTGYVRGAGLMVQRTLGPGRLEARYEYTHARRSIDSLFSASVQPVPWGEPHRLELALDLAARRDLTLLARWRGVWGRTWGFRQGYYDFLGAFPKLVDIPASDRPKLLKQIERYALQDPGSNTLPPIYQLDLSVAYARTLGPVRWQLRADVLNVLDRENVAEWQLLYDEDSYYEEGSPDSGYLLRRPKRLLPRLYALALKVSW